jgi:hypothetical protein
MVSKWLSKKSCWYFTTGYLETTVWLSAFYKQEYVCSLILFSRQYVLLENNSWNTGSSLGSEKRPNYNEQ